MPSSGSSRVAQPRQRQSRIACRTAASAATTAVGAPSGSSTHSSRAGSRVSIASRSRRAAGCGSLVAPALTSQFRVKLGTMRPPTSAIRVMKAATVARSTTMGSPPCCTTTWNAMLAVASPAMTIRILRFFQFLPARISRAATAPTTGRKLASIIAEGTVPTELGASMTRRPATQSRDSARSGRPATGSRPVQLGMAVIRKPVIAAAAKPNSISWACHSSGP